MGSFTLLRLLFIFCFIFGPMACHSGPGETTLERIQREKKIKVGFANEAPFAYVNSQTGQLTGEAPEIAKHLLKDLGVTQVEGVLTEFGSLIPGLKAGRFDLIAAGMYITPKRARQIAFTQPTYCLGGAFLVPKGNPKNLHRYADVAKNPDIRLGIMTGAVETDYARAAKVKPEQISYFPDPVSALEAVGVGRVDAFAATSLTARDLLAKRNKTDVEMAHPFHDPIIHGTPAQGCGAFALRPKDTALLKALNDQLDTFVGSPRHLELVRPFGFGPEEMPGNINLKQLTQE